jgi:hypothetical protein
LEAAVNLSYQCGFSCACAANELDDHLGGSSPEITETDQLSGHVGSSILGARQLGQAALHEDAPQMACLLDERG